MHKQRLEAFSDGVLAIIITIMVLELKVPHGDTFADLRPLIPIFFSYVSSFLFISIYWNNHHHMLHAAQKVNGRILWANAHLLFWLSLIPFTTSWMGEHAMATGPVILYGVNLLLSGAAYSIFTHQLINHHGPDSLLASAIGKDSKGLISLGLYSAAIGIAFWFPLVSYLLYTAVALMWLVPDLRIVKLMENHN